MKRAVLVATLAGLLPLVSAHAAFLVNVSAGFEACFAYLEGCYSASRAIRSGPGLTLFKTVAPLATATMAWCWLQTGQWLKDGLVSRSAADRWIMPLGVVGAVFYVVYATWLGTDGELYRWLRRYGVVFYFAGTALAHLLLFSSLWRQRARLYAANAGPAAKTYFSIVILMWGSGIGSAFKRKLIDDPAFLDRVENALEWNFALLLSLSFVALAWLRQASAIARDPAGS